MELKKIQYFKGVLSVSSFVALEYLINISWALNMLGTLQGWSCWEHRNQGDWDVTSLSQESWHR